MKIVLLAKDLELSLHLHYQFVLELTQFALKLASLFFMLSAECISLLFGMFLHQAIHSILLSHLQLTQLLSEI